MPLSNLISSGLLGRKVGIKGTYSISFITSLITLICGLWAFYEVVLCKSPVILKLGSWINIEYLQVDWELTFDSITVSMFLAVNIVSCLVQIYSMEYMKDDPHVQRFFAYLSLFTLLMLILVTGNNYLVMFLGWEGVGISSFLLVSFWYQRTWANTSAMSAILYNRVGDMFLQIGIFLLFFVFGNIDYNTIFALSYNIDENLIILIGILLIIGAMAKSAQIGLHVWLPQAMEGPTPVSALIHAATMVTAGIYLLIRSSPILEYSSFLLTIIVWLGAITALFAGLCGLFMNDIKKIIAYSTMSQLGYMVVSIGLSSYTLALFHLINHAFFKASLFMAAGAVIHALNDNQSILKFGGLSRLLPFISQVILISSLALLAYPFTSGYYSKELIISMTRNIYNPFYSHLYSESYLNSSINTESIINSESNNIININNFNDFYLNNLSDSLLFNLLNYPIYWIVTITALITCLYSYKLIYYTFLSHAHGPYNYYENIHYSSNYINIPLIILTLLSIFSGYLLSDIFVGIGNNILSDTIFIHPIHSKLIETEFNTSTLFKLFPLLLSILGIIIYTLILENTNLTIGPIFESMSLNLKKWIVNSKVAQTTYEYSSKKNFFLSKIYTSIFTFFNQKFYYEFLINTFIVQKILNLSYTLNKTLDRGFIELWGPFGLSTTLSKLSFYISRLDTGIVTTYSLYMFLGLQIYCIIIYSLIQYMIL